MIRHAQKSDAKAIAILHQKTLAKSFLASLGVGFLEILYRFLIKKEIVIVYSDDDVLKGFVAFSKHSSGMMKRFLFTCPMCVIKLIGIMVSKPAFLKRVVETFATPFKSKISVPSSAMVKLPHAEILSIAVEPYFQKTGIGGQLLVALEDHLKQIGISKYKVIAGGSLDSANRFYLRNNFAFISQIIIHGNELSNIYTKKL